MNRSRNYITAMIDGEPVRVRRGSTVLEAARQTGIYIPTLCYLENLESYGGCRLCIVEIKGMKGFPTACTTPLEPGMEIATKTPEIQSLRRNILEMTLSEHPYTCLVCGDKKECTEFMHTTRKAGTITGCNFCTSNGDCELQDLIEYLDLKDVRYPISYRGIPPVKNNPFYDLDYNLCILCGRCVRICNEERNSNVLAFVQRGNSTLVGTGFGESQTEAGCEFCGACVDVCPTGSISGKLGKWAGLPERSVKTTCTLCSVGCPMNVNTRDGRIVEVGPPPGARVNPYQLCIRGKFLLPDLSQHPERITRPQIRKNGRWVEVEWDEALEFTARNLGKHQGKGFGMLCSEQDTLEENYILQKFSRSVMKSKNIDLISKSQEKDISESIVSLLRGSDGDVDLETADTILLLGTDAAVTHPLLENRIRKAFNRGACILYGNDQPTRTSRFTGRDAYFKTGTEPFFLYALLDALTKSVPGLPASLSKQLSEPVLAKALKACSVERGKLEAFAGSLEKARRLLIIAGGGFLEGSSTRNTVRAMGNILALKEGSGKCGIMIPGFEGNVYGSYLSGVRPEGGLNRDQMLAGIGSKSIVSLMVAGDLPPDTKMKKLKFLVQLNMFRNGLSEFADVFLPVSGLLENEGHFLALDGKIKRVRRTLPPPGNARTIPSIIRDLALKMDQSGFSCKPSEIWNEIRGKIKSPVSGTGKIRPKYQSLSPPEKPAAWKKPAGPRTRSEDYLYRGNLLGELIPDLRVLLNQLSNQNM
jgi:formate dehydrogenase alpha subunit